MKLRVQRYEVSRRLHGMLSLVDPAGVRAWHTHVGGGVCESEGFGVLWDGQRGLIGDMRSRSTETSNGLAAIQAQLNNLGREIKKVNEKVYDAQVGCEQCKGPHYTKDCPLKEEGKTLEEAYYMQFEVGEAQLTEPEIIHETTEKIFKIRDRMQWCVIDKRATLTRGVGPLNLKLEKRKDWDPVLPIGIAPGSLRLWTERSSNSSKAVYLSLKSVGMNLEVQNTCGNVRTSSRANTLTCSQIHNLLQRLDFGMKSSNLGRLWHPVEFRFRMDDLELSWDGSLSLTYHIGNSLHYQDLEWYEALEDSELKDKALRNKAIMKGSISGEKSCNDGWRRWESHEITYHDHDEIENETHDERQELCEAHELPVCNIRRFKMIKYSFGQDEEYVAVKEDEYDNLARTSNEACRAYQEIFRIMDE
ncbi:hypothetical protein Tco_0002074 [Tanacetum coccineum]